MEGCLFETFRWDLKWDVLFETFQTYHGGLLIWNFQMRLEMRCAIRKTCQTYHGGLLIWNFQMRLEMRCAIWNLLKLFKPIMEGCLFQTFRWDLKWDVPNIWLETFETFQTYHWGLLIWNFQMRLEMRCAIWNFWNFSNLSWRVAYLKLSDETWNEMCYLKLLKLFKPIMEGCLFETFRWDLKWDVLFETLWNLSCCWNFETLFSNMYHGDLFQTSLKWDVHLKLFKPIMECCLFETFRWDLKWDVLFETFETFQTYHGGLLIWNFQMRLEMRCAIRNFWNFSNLSWSVAYWKLSDETWNEMCY